MDSGNRIGVPCTDGIFIVLRRCDKRGRDWCSGVMRTAVDRFKCRPRLIEPGDSDRIDFGDTRPAGVFAYSVPEKAVRAALSRGGAEAAPVIAFPQEPSETKSGICVRLDARGIADAAAQWFDSCECASVAWIGAHSPCERSSSDAIGAALAAMAGKRGLAFASFERLCYEGVVMRPAERERLDAWLAELPKPCGVLAWTDLLAEEALDACRRNSKRLKAKKTVFAMGIGNDDLVCGFSNPPLASVDLAVHEAGCAAVLEMERLLKGREGAQRPEIVCRVRQIEGRDSASNEKSEEVVVAQALKLIDEKVRKGSKLGQHDIARHLGISVRKLQMCFKAADKKGRTILQAIHEARLRKACRMLSRTNKPIKAITFAVGFGSVSRLKGLFQERYGMNMRDWRKLHRK